MTKDCKEIVDDLKDKITDYEKLLEQLTQEKKQIGKIIAGPFIETDGKQYYRVSFGGDESVVEYDNKNILFKSTDVPLELGCEIACIKASVVGVLPSKLIVAKEEPTFDFIKWEDIGGLKSQVERVRHAIELPLNNAALMEEFGLAPIKGILLSGPPGCGKTLIAKAIASTVLAKAKAKADAFLYVKGAEMLSMYVGATEQHIGRMFKQCRSYSAKHGHRAIIFIDEADALLPARGSRVSSDVDTTIVPTFLSEMDGFDGHAPIVILSTNFPGSLDPAVVRPGRIDIKVSIDRPTLEDSIDIFKIHLKKHKTLDEVDMLAEGGAEMIFTNGLAKKVSGALIQTAVQQSASLAVKRAMNQKGKKGRGIIVEDLYESLKTIEAN